MNLYDHQVAGAQTLKSKTGYLLAWEMGTGKTRTALSAALQLFAEKRIDRAVVLCPAAVKFAWGEELGKLMIEGVAFTLVSYNPKEQKFFSMLAANQLAEKLGARGALPIVIVSYALLQQRRHSSVIQKWCEDEKSLLVCDESSFLKNRTAEQTRGAMIVSKACKYTWLLSGTPIANSPLDLWSQAEVMSPERVKGPLKGFGNFYHFRSTFGIMGGFKNKQVVAFRNLEKLQESFAPFVSRLEKKDCLQLPEKTYTTREVVLSPQTWKLYKELRQDALMTLSEDDVRVEPNAAVRLMRLCQLTSGYVGGIAAQEGFLDPEMEAKIVATGQDLSSEKIDWLVSALVDGELASEEATIVWCRWRRERERIAEQLLGKNISVFQLHGGQSQHAREGSIQNFQNFEPIIGFGRPRRVMLAQPHAGGYGLTLTAAKCAVYLSNDFSYTTRVQSEDRCHRVGQRNPVTYIDIIATGPEGQRTIDTHINAALKAKQSVANWTCAAWRKALE